MRENIIVQAQPGDASSGGAPEGRLDSPPAVEPTAHV